MSDKEIAFDLGLTLPMAKLHLRQIFDKAGVRNRVQLSVLVIQMLGPLPHKPAV